MASVAAAIIVVAAAVGVTTMHGNQPTSAGGGVQAGGGNRVPGAGMAPAAFVLSSAQTTLHQHTAEVNISGSVSAKGQSIPLSGTGYADFDEDAFWADMTVSIPSGVLDEHEIVVGGHLYFGLGAGGFNISQITGGPHWIDVPVPQQNSSQLGAGNVDPLTQLQVLEQKGATVTPLGSSTMGGTVVSGYSVTPSVAEEQQALQQEVQSGTIPASAVPMLQQELQAIGSPTMDVYFDGSGLLHKLTMTFGGGSSGVSASVQMTFDGYGSTVNIAPPASSDVLSYAQFLQDAQASRTPSI